MVDDVGGSDVFGDENNGGFSWINNWIKGTWVEEVEHYLHYVGGGAGALALTGVAAVSALYLASRPTGEEPLVPLEQQCKIVGCKSSRIRYTHQGIENSDKMVDDVGGSDVFGDENNGGFSWINNWIKGTWVEEVEHYLHYVGGGAGALALTGVAAVSALYLASRPTGEEPLVPLEQQCKIVGGSENIHVSRFCKEAEEGKYISYIDEDTRTLYDTFRKGAKVSNNGPCLGWRETTTSPYTWLNYNETLLRARNFGSGLVGLGLNPGPETLIGVYAQNCPEWILTEQGAYCYGMVIVPLYDTLGPRLALLS
ncbi:uncharacterized protein LOC113374726 [Ctenocephalides felis]|uniref:uncharacterized protein LOC113374726 n=1 Tax=Ctenocephalides felis TaxID=7515 RepID=UPI000E6E4811|nr:uncharacterized protein LOC113374726 [Ctenocephalides felis]